MKSLKHPNFILGAVSLLLFILAIVFKANQYDFGNYVLVAAVGLGAIHWVWAITDVLKHQPTGSQSRVFWLILVVLIPPLGGMIYYLMGRKQMQM